MPLPCHNRLNIARASNCTRFSQACSFWLNFCTSPSFFLFSPSFFLFSPFFFLFSPEGKKRKKSELLQKFSQKEQAYCENLVQLGADARATHVQSIMT